MRLSLLRAARKDILTMALGPQPFSHRFITFNSRAPILIECCRGGCIVSPDFSRVMSGVSQLPFYRKSIHIMARRAASRHVRQPLENLLRGLFLDHRIRQGIHIFVNRHAHLLEW